MAVIITTPAKTIQAKHRSVRTLFHAARAADLLLSPLVLTESLADTQTDKACPLLTRLAVTIGR